MCPTSHLIVLIPSLCPYPSSYPSPFFHYIFFLDPLIHSAIQESDSYMCKTCRHPMLEHEKAQPQVKTLRLLSFLSLLILSYLILSYLILSNLILSYLIFIFILSYPILSYLILSYLILSYLILSSFFRPFSFIILRSLERESPLYSCTALCAILPYLLGKQT